MKEKIRPLSFVIWTLALGLAPHLNAAPGAILLDAPDFIIPIGESGTLDLYSDGRAPETSGFNALGRQRITLQANSVSSGSLTLNLHFPGFSLDAEELAAGLPEGAALRLTLRDFDLVRSRVSGGATFQETAALSAINGVPLTSLMPLASYLPAGRNHTDNQTLTLDPLLLKEPSLAESFFGPLVLSFTLTATLTTGPSSITVFNTPEHIASEVRLTMVPEVVPEPSTLALLGVGALWLAFAMRRRR
jgi:hypothetical protein